MIKSNLSKHILRIIGMDRAIENESIVRRLTVRLGVTVLVVSVFAGIAMNSIVSQAVMRDFEQKANEALTYLTSSLARPLWILDREVAKSIAQAVFLDKSIGRVVVRNDLGTVICSLKKGPASNLITREGRISFQQWGEEHIVGDVSVSIYPDIYGKNHQRQLIVSMIIIFMIMVSVMTVVVIFFRTSLDRPIKKLSEITSQFASGRYCTDEINLPYVEFQPFGRVLAEMGEKIGEQIKKVREAEAKYRIVADNTYDWEFWTDANGQYVYISPACQRITGFPAETFKTDPALLDTIIHPDDLVIFRNHTHELEMKARNSSGSVEFRIHDKDGQVHWIEHLCQPIFDEDGKWLGTRGSNRDVTSRKETEQLKKLAASILTILNEPAALTATIHRILETIQQELAFDAVGLRLQKGDDFPYFASIGFSDDFLITENTLVVRDREGAVCRDKNGNISLECTCGLVISGKTDPTNPLFTPGGSCWTNNSFPLLDLPLDQDPRLNPRNLCIHKNFLSIALIPIRANNEILGLLQLNDRKKNRLTPEMISSFEEICGSIGLALKKKQAEEALQEAERQQRTLIENLPDCIVRFDANGRFIFASPAVQRTFGVGPDELIGKTPSESNVPGEDPRNRKLDQLFKQALTEGVPNRNESQWATVNGLRDFDILHVPEKDEAGKVVSVLAIAHDITEHKRADAALRESEAEYRRIVNTTTEGIWGVGPDLLTTFVNVPMAEMLGCSREEMIGRPVTDFMFMEDVADHYQKMERRKRGISEHYERRFRHKSGQAVWTSASAAPVFDDEHRFIRAFSMFTDITERKQAEQKNAWNLAINQTLSSLYVPLVTIGTSIEQMADAVLEKSRQLTGSAHGYVAEIDPATGDLIAHTLTKMFQTECKVAEEEQRKVRFSQRADGLYNGLWGHTLNTMEPFYTDEPAKHPAFVGVPEGHIAILKILSVPVLLAGELVGQIVLSNTTRAYTDRDLDAINRIAEFYALAIQHKRAGDKIHKLNQELEERVVQRTIKLEAANKELEAFAYSISHDLRAPLRHIDGFIELLQKRGGTAQDEKSRHYMDTISDAAQKMGRLIDDLLFFSRTGRKEMSFQPVDLSNLVREVIAELEPDGVGRNIEWRIGDLPEVSGDGAMLRLVLVNLISNAMKYTRPRQRTEIEIESIPGQDAETVIFVRDNGVGFDMTYVDRLFGVFQRLHREEEFEGTGIGLANVRRIITRHGGRVWAEGKVDQGASFYFTLPHRLQIVGDEKPHAPPAVRNAPKDERRTI